MGMLVIGGMELAPDWTLEFVAKFRMALVFMKSFRMSNSKSGINESAMISEAIISGE